MRYIYIYTKMDTVVQNDHITNAKIGSFSIGHGKDIDEIICINLETRPDKREFMLIEWKNYPFRFFTAKPHTNPVIGCSESHASVIKYAKENNFKRVLILEDDAKIVGNLETLPAFPSDFKILYLGGLCTHIFDWNFNNWVWGRFYCNHAYIVDASIFDEIIKVTTNCNVPYDHCIVDKINNNYKCYAIKIAHVIQNEGHSDIDNKYKWKDFKWPMPGEMFNIP
jgi:GR25 family glycosyltransferase involved in LPS biosynthesis